MSALVLSVFVACHDPPRVDEFPPEWDEPDEAFTLDCATGGPHRLSRKAGMALQLLLQDRAERGSAVDPAIRALIAPVCQRDAIDHYTDKVPIDELFDQAFATSADLYGCGFVWKGGVMSCGTATRTLSLCTGEHTGRMWRATSSL